MSAVTIKQIAKESGVSIATVSRVLNGTAPVAETTRERVRAAIERHNYSPNSLARGLASRRSMTLGVILPDIANPYFASMFREMESAARSAGYSVLLCNTGFRAEGSAELTRRELEAFQTMLDKAVDGVIVAGGQADLVDVRRDYRQALERLAAAVPTVVIGDPVPGTACIFIQRERGLGVLAAVNYLASLGHTSIAFAGGEEGVGITEARLGAYADALSALSLPYNRALVSPSDYYAPDGYDAVNRLLERGASFTALLVMNDSVALGAYRALADVGLAVPGDVSVVSCDQFFDAGFFVPRLTSVDQHNSRFGRFVVDALLRAMSGIRESKNLGYRPELVVRESCTAVNQNIGKEVSK